MPCMDSTARGLSSYVATDRQMTVFQFGWKPFGVFWQMFFLTYLLQDSLTYVCTAGHLFL